MTTHNAVNADRLLDTFLELLAIDSPSHEEEAVIRHLDARLTQFGLETRIDETGNLIGRLAGAGEPLLLCAHVDHVPPLPGHPTRRRRRSDSHRWLDGVGRR